MDENQAFWHGYDDAKYGFTYVSDDAASYGRGWAAYLTETQEKDNA